MDANPVSATPTPSDVDVPWSRIERFVGLWTHDIRNGLNAIELQLTLLGEISDDPEVKIEVKKTRRSVADVTRQLQSLRILTSSPVPHFFEYPAADFVEDLRERFDRQNADASTRVHWEVAAGAASHEIDPELSMSAVLELLGNALFFAAHDSTIRVQTSNNATGLTFSIEETLAVAPADSPAEWGLCPMSSTRRDGYGLGVFRARRIIEAQKGALNFAFFAADQSLVTTVVLPAADAVK